MRLFLSYASEQKDLAREVYQALLQEGHDVFFDQSGLQAASGYHAKIRKEVKRSDGFVFLISPASLTKGCYTLTELGYAKKKWKDPTGHVLPAMVESMEMGEVDAYLRTVTIMTPQGNAAAEIADAVSELKPSGGGVDTVAVRKAANLPFYIKCTAKRVDGQARELRVRYGLTAGAVFTGLGVLILAQGFLSGDELKQIISYGGGTLASLAIIPAKGILPARAKLNVLELLQWAFEGISPDSAASGDEPMPRLVESFHQMIDSDLRVKG